MKPKFQLGQTLATPGALKALEESGQSPGFFLDQHVQGIWGDVDAEDRRANDEALVNGERSCRRTGRSRGNGCGSSPRRWGTRASGRRRQFLDLQNTDDSFHVEKK